MSFRKRSFGKKRGKQSSGTYEQVVYLNQMVNSLYGQGQYEEALQFADQACNLARRILGKDDPEYASSLNNMAVVQGAVGNYTAAEALYKP
jgi:hypothetical protein